MLFDEKINRKNARTNLWKKVLLFFCENILFGKNITDFSKPISTDCKFKIFSLGRMRILFLFFFSFKANLGQDLLIYLYSIHRAICRSSDHSVCAWRGPSGRAELEAETLTTRPPHLTKNIPKILFP